MFKKRIHFLLNLLSTLSILQSYIFRSHSAVMSMSFIASHLQIKAVFVQNVTLEHAPLKEDTCDKVTKTNTVIGHIASESGTCHPWPLWQRCVKRKMARELL